MIHFNSTAQNNDRVRQVVEEFLNDTPTLETEHGMPVIIFQDGASGAYYVKCSLLAESAHKLCDLNAKLDISGKESYRANRELLLKNATYLKMQSDAVNGREFNDIIVEYNKNYAPESPLKVWGGQHRISAISHSRTKINRYHGFRVYFELDKKQRTEVALISNTNIAVSNDTFDRMMEETHFGDTLRKWCQAVGFLEASEDFPDVGSRSERISVKQARSFVVNFYLGQKRGAELKTSELDQKVYEPYLVKSGVVVDPEYEKLMSLADILKDKKLLQAGKRFLALHNAQHRAVTDAKTSIRNMKAYRNKAFVESVLCAWSYVAGLLQAHQDRLENHYRIPKVTRAVPDPLNAEDMSKYKHDSDAPTYRGLGTRSALKDRQRVAQLFLAKSCEENVLIDRKFMDKAVSQVVGLLSLAKGYT